MKDQGIHWYKVRLGLGLQKKENFRNNEIQNKN